MKHKSLIGMVFRDPSLYGRGGKRGKRVRLVGVVAQQSDRRVICQSWWTRGPLAGSPPRRVKILIRTLLSSSHYKQWGAQ